MSMDNPYAAPLAEIHTTVESGDPQLADRGTRFVAAFLDGVIGLACSLPLMYSVGFFDSTPAGRNVPFTTLMGLSVVCFLGFLLVHGYTLHKNGQTLGKKMLGIRIADPDDGIPDFGRLVGLRYLPMNAVSLIPAAGPILSLVDVLFIFRSDRRCVHDLLAGTKVVKVTPRKKIQPEL
jgi:uncharacterized RDD family membrane protein YckC